MLDRIKQNLFIEETGDFSPQEISHKLYTSKNLRLSLDFGPHSSKSFREQSITNWMTILPKLNNVEKLLLMNPKSQTFFANACKMTQLQTLILNSLKIDDLTPISNLKLVNRLHIISCHQLKRIFPVLTLRNIDYLKIENCYNIEDLELIGQMSWLKGLCLTGDSFAPKRLRLKSLKPFHNLKQLRHLDLSTTSVVDKSYEILLDLPNLERFDTTSNIKTSLVNDIKLKHKTLKAGFFVDWDYANNKFFDDKRW